MTNRAKSLAIVLSAAGIAASLAACSSGPSRPSWCQPLIAQFHAKETRQAYLDGLAALQKQGAPLATLISDETVLARDEATAGGPSSGTAGFSAVTAAAGVARYVIADQKQLNQECGQPADAYKSDNA
jgi:hypothetical protein